MNDDQKYDPYFLESFLEIIKNLKQSNEFKSCFHGSIDYLDKFIDLTKPSQIIFLRIFSRKKIWYNKESLNSYFTDYVKYANELCQFGFFETFKNDDIQIALQEQKLEFIHQIYKQTFPLEKPNKSKHILIKHIIQTISKPVYFSQKKSLKDIILEKCLKSNNLLYRIPENVKNLFLKTLVFYSLPNTLYEKLEERKNIFYTMLQAKIGNLSFPCYEIDHTKNSVVFPSLDIFDQFFVLLQLYDSALEKFEKKMYQNILDTLTCALESIAKFYDIPLIGQTTNSHEIKVFSQPTQQDSDIEEILVDDSNLKQTVKQAKSSLSNDIPHILHFIQTCAESTNTNVSVIAAEIKRINALPAFLRRYTALSIFLRIISLAAETACKLRDYELAAQLTKFLLQWPSISASRRGYWWVRLALITDRHLRDGKRALEITKEALADSNVRGPHRKAVYDRYISLMDKYKTGANKDIATQPILIEPDLDITLNHIPSTTISGKLLPKPDNNLAGKSVYISTSSKMAKTTTLSQRKLSIDVDEFDLPPNGNEECEREILSISTTLCNVETIALQHYLDNEGFTSGVHCEGSVFTSLIILAFWDEIWLSDIPDAYRYPLQTCPLDWGSDSFFKSRASQFEVKLQKFKQSVSSTLESCGGDMTSTQYLTHLITNKWEFLCGTQHEETNLNPSPTKSPSKKKMSAPVTFPGLDWAIFGELHSLNARKTALDITRCLGAYRLAMLAERYLKDHRHYRSGWPDLVVWNTKTNKLKTIEVKGPGDKLSQKQTLWLDYMKSIGLDCEVCHVKTTNSKRKRLKP